MASQYTAIPEMYGMWDEQGIHLEEIARWFKIEKLIFINNLCMG